MPRKREMPEGRMVRLRRHIAEWLRGAREERGWSARELETRSGISASEILRLETFARECRLESMVKLANALGWPPGLLIDELLHFASRTNEYLEAVEADGEFVALAARFGLIGNRRDLFAGALSSWANWMDILTRSGNATREAGRLDSSEVTRKALLRFAERLDKAFSPKERLALLGSLGREPLAELRRQGLLSEAAIVDAVERVDALRAGAFDGSSKVAPVAKRRESGVDTFQEIEYTHVVSLTWKQLKSRLKAAGAIPGNKAAMARAAKVNQSSVNSWLDDDREPGAEATFRLLEWVEAEEAKTKSAVAAETAAAPKTQKDHTYESSKSKSGREKK